MTEAEITDPYAVERFQEWFGAHAPRLIEGIEAEVGENASSADTIVAILGRLSSSVSIIESEIERRLEHESERAVSSSDEADQPETTPSNGGLVMPAYKSSATPSHRPMQLKDWEHMPGLVAEQALLLVALRSEVLKQTESAEADTLEIAIKEAAGAAHRAHNGAIADGYHAVMVRRELNRIQTTYAWQNSDLAHTGRLVMQTVAQKLATVSESGLPHPAQTSVRE